MEFEPRSVLACAQWAKIHLLKHSEGHFEGIEMGVTIDFKISLDSNKASLCYWSSHQTPKMCISDINLVAVSCSSKG